MYEVEGSDLYEAPLADVSSSHFIHSDMQRFGWYLSEKNALKTEFGRLAVNSEARQEPSGLTPVPVDMTQRFKSVLLHQNHRFYVASIVMTLILSIAYICLPCSVAYVNMNNYLFLFTNRTLAYTFYTLSNSSLAVTFLRKTFKAPEMALVVILNVTLSLLVFIYLLPAFTSQATWLSGLWLELSVYFLVALLFGGIWVFCFFAWAWPQADATVLVQFTCLVVTYYVYLCGLLQIVWLNTSHVHALNNWFQSFLFAMFFVWSTLCQRVFQSLSRRIAIGIARVEGHPVQWYDLLRSQCFLLSAYTLQGAYYRLLIFEIGSWEMKLLFIVMHILQEVMTYAVRLRPRVREWERWLLFRSRIGRQLLSPVLPMSVWMDLHYLDFFLKKVAELSALFFFVARFLLCRYASWISDCYTPKIWSSELVMELLQLSGVLFVGEVASGLIFLYFSTGMRRGFVIRTVVSSRQLMVLFTFCIVGSTCGVTNFDAVQQVKSFL